MNFQEAVKIVNKAIYEKEGRGITDAEEVVLKGSWENLTYEEMAQKFPYTANYLKGDMGHKFWKLLSEALGERVGKRNFKAALERARSRFLVEDATPTQLEEVPDYSQTQTKESTARAVSALESDKSPKEISFLRESSSSTEKHKMAWQIVLELDKLDDLEPIIKQLEKLGEGSMTVKRIEKGSIVLTVETAPEFYERINYLFNSGQLKEVLGIPLLQIRQVTKLSGWFEGIFEIGWQTVEEILGPPKFVGYQFRNSWLYVERAKLLDLETAKEQIALLVALQPESDTEMDIQVAVYPSANQTHLPEMLELSVLDELAEEVIQTVARNGDNGIRLSFSGEVGEHFSLKVALGEASVIETFVI